MVILKNKQKIFSVVTAVIVIFALVFGTYVSYKEAGAISLACQNSPDCLKAVEKEKQALQAAAQAASSANMFQAKVNELSAEIAGKEAEIAETEAEVQTLKKQIEIAEKKLGEQQVALAELLVNMHFESDAEPIRILAGSTSISDLAEKAAREQVAKEQISLSATEIKQTKAQLEIDKAEVEKLLAQQQLAKESLVAKREEQRNLVIKYENDAVGYEAAAIAARQEARAAEEAYQRAHPTSSNSFAGAFNSYPWQNQCPRYYYDDIHINERGEEVYTPPSVYVYSKIYNGSYIAGTIYENPGTIIGGVLCQCTSYAGWKVYESYRIVINGWGDAKSWGDSAKRAGYRVDHNPTAGSVGQYSDGVYGHVFWVESVNSNGSINITEYNSWWGTKNYTGNGTMGDFGSEVIDAGMASGYNYIHFK